MGVEKVKVSAKALVVWLTAMCVYIVAIAGRTSFGVAGVHAIDRFDIDASRLAVFTSVQVGVYALAQIPMGMLVDRFDARKLLLAGALILAAGQLILGFTDSYMIAIFARVLIGVGDSSAFLSVMRLLPNWFPMSWTPVLQQLTGAFGFVGQFFSAVPFLHMLNTLGWTIPFASLGAVGIIVAIAAAILVRDAPASSEPSRRGEASISIAFRLKSVLTSLYCWQGVFNHWVSMGPVMVFLLLWGTPTLTLGLGISSGEVGTVLTIFAVATVITGPLSGIVSSRLGARRGMIGFVTPMIQSALWIVLFLFADRLSNPLVFVSAIMFAISFSSPVANFGFDTIREKLDRRVMVAGTGMANMGAYICAMLATQIIGFLLDWNADGHAYTWSNFQVAWLGLGAVWLAGMIGLAVCLLLQRRKNIAFRR